MASRTIAIGDIHGCDQALDSILNAIELQPDDTIVTLGDYIDRGPNSRAVIDRLIDLQQHCQLIPLIGNHEVMLLASMEEESQKEFWIQFGGQETLGSYDEDGRIEAIPEAHIDFIRRCRYYYETNEFIFLHASYTPQLPLEKQSDLVLLWEHLIDHVPSPHCSGKTAIVGHTPQREGEVLDLGHVICIDTYCFGGGWLTALDVTNRTLWQSNLVGELRTTESSLD